MVAVVVVAVAMVMVCSISILLWKFLDFEVSKRTHRITIRHSGFPAIYIFPKKKDTGFDQNYSRDLIYITST